MLKINNCFGANMEKPFKIPTNLSYFSSDLLNQRVIIDVDAGADDAVALMIFFLAECLGLIRIEAITTVRGNAEVDNVTTNVMRILETINRTDIPVYKGAHHSFIPPEMNGDGFQGMDGFGDQNWSWQPDLNRLKKEHAAVAMGRIISENPGEIIVIGLGPSTNIALAMMLYHNFADDVKAVHLMGGNYKAVGNMSPASEFNFYMDPEAAFIVLYNAKKLVRVLPWEAATEITISPDWRFKVLGAIKNPILELITPAEKIVYPDKNPYYNPADALFAAAFLYPKKAIKKQESFPGTVELHGSETRGQVVLDHYNMTEPNVVMIQQVDQEFFKNLLIYAATHTIKTCTPKKA